MPNCALWIVDSGSPLPTSHFPLRTFHFALSTSHFPPSTSHFPLPTFHSPLPTSHFPLRTSHSPEGGINPVIQWCFERHYTSVVQPDVGDPEGEYNRCSHSGSRLLPLAQRFSSRAPIQLILLVPLTKREPQ